MLVASAGEAARREAMDRAMFHDAVDLVLDRYVERVERPRVLRATLDDFVSNLDPYSYVLDPETAREEPGGDTTRGVDGIGAALVVRSTARTPAQIEVAFVREGTPAALAGIHVGDVVRSLDDREASTFRHQGELDRYLRSFAGESLRLQVRSRDGDSTRTLRVPRRRMAPVDLVEATMVTVGAKNLVWLRIRTFLIGTQGAVEAAIDAHREDSFVPIDGWVLDLRGNPGGVVDEAVGVADLFLREGLITRFRGRGGQIVRQERASAADSDVDAPVAVLQDRYTASAAELLATALGSSGRALLVGERSFGKGSVQELLGLADGSKIRLTVAHYYGPNDEPIHGHGVAPDVLVGVSTMVPREIEASVASALFAQTTAAEDSPPPQNGR
jgi:carboxyl-terminal processing protease